MTHVQPIRWDDLDPTERKCLRQVANGNFLRRRSTRQQRRARARLLELGLLEFCNRQWRISPRGETVLGEAKGPSRDDLLCWAAEQPCEYGPGDEGQPCVEDDPDYRCMPCWAYETLYGERKHAD